MTASAGARAGTGARSSVALALALTLVAGVVLALGVRPAAALDADADADVGIVLDSLTPQVAGPGGTLRVTGRVVTDGGPPLPGASVQLRVDRTPLTSRSEVQLAASGAEGVREGSVVPGSRVAVGVDVDVADPSATGSVPFEVAVPLESLRLGRFGVHLLTVEVLDQELTRVARQRTFLPWNPSVKEYRETAVAWLLPLVGTPRRVSPRRVEGSTQAVFLDDSLGEELRPGGRLSRLVALGAGSPVTWLMDPDLLEAVADMADGYLLDSPTGPVPGTHGAAAAAWLDSLRRASTGAEVLALPYADVDVAGLVGAGLPELVGKAYSRAEGVTARVLGRPVTPAVGWLHDGGADPRALGVLGSADLRAVVVDGALVPPLGPLTYTPTGRAELSVPGGSIEAVISDPQLTELVVAPVGTPALALQRLLAETAMITAAQPGRTHTVLVAPPRDWDPSLPVATAMLASVEAAPWTVPSTLGQLLAAPMPEVERAPSEPAETGGRAGPALPLGYLRSVAGLEGSAERLAAVLEGGSPQLVETYRDVVLRLSSVQWEGNPQRAAVLDALTAGLQAQQSGVRIVPGNVTFGGTSGVIPISVENTLDAPVTVQVRLTPTVGRIRVEGSEPLTVPPGEVRQLPVRAEAIATGIVYVDAQLLTLDGEPFGVAERKRVRVTEYGTVGLLLTLGAALVLFGTATLRVVRRTRAASRSGREQHP